MKKRLLAILTVIVFVLTMSLPVFAAPISDGSLTVTGNDLDGKSVYAYKVFSASGEDTDGDGVISEDDAVTYTLVNAWEGFFQANTVVQEQEGTTLSEKAVNYVKSRTDTQLIELARALKEYAQDNTIPADFQQTADGNSVTIEDVAPGYYLVIPEKGSTSETRHTDATLLNVPSGASASWAIKSVYPTVEKTISDGDTAGTASIGDTVEFTLTSKVPDLSEYEDLDYYTFRFNDTLSSGLTYDDHLVVKIGTHELTADEDYTVTFGDAEHQNDQHYVHVSIGKSKTVEGNTVTDLKELIESSDNYNIGDTVTVTYQAVLNENAFIQNDGDENTLTYNNNTATLTYSNDPDDETSVGTSTPTETKTYTYEITIDKHDDSQQPIQLPGATFRLKDEDDNVISLFALDPITDDEQNVLADCYRVAVDGDTQTVTTVTTEATGKIVIKGLAAGTYTLEETNPPSGYTQLAGPVTITIAPGNSGTAQEPVYDDYEHPTFTVNGEPDDDVIGIVNTKGAMLPTTGGIGTIGLTAAGVAIVIFGIVITSRRKKSKDSEKAE